jgi:hypothetical protein
MIYFCNCTLLKPSLTFEGGGGWCENRTMSRCRKYLNASLLRQTSSLRTAQVNLDVCLLFSLWKLLYFNVAEQIWFCSQITSSHTAKFLILEYLCFYALSSPVNDTCALFFSANG